jgi:hypothetical protein
LRAAVLERLYDHEASPVALAREMGEPLPNVAYHVRELRSSAQLRSYGSGTFEERSSTLTPRRSESASGKSPSEDVICSPPG